MKNLPKKVETEVVVKFLEDSFVSFEKRIDEKFDAQFGELKREMNQKLGDFRQGLRKDSDEKFGELNQKVDLIGSLITNTHQEVKHFVEMHQLLDGKVADLERRVTHLEHVVKHQQA